MGRRRGRGVRSSGKKSRQFPHIGILSGGQTRFYRTVEDASRAERDSRYAQAEARKSVVRTRVWRNREDLGDVYPFYGATQPSEQQFVRWADSRGIELGRNGWPDFYCQSPSGGMAAVEVKRGLNDPLRADQLKCFSFLEALGVEVFVFNSAWSRARSAPALVPWREYSLCRDTDWPGMDSGGKAAGRSKTSGKQGLDLSPPHENPASDDRRIPEVLGDPPTLH